MFFQMLFPAHVDCRDAVQWVCEFIEAQAQEKPYLQTKSLHTSIVAAFKTLMVWVMEHPHLLAHEVGRISNHGIPVIRAYFFCL